MKKLILSISILGLVFIGCDNSTEPADCAGVAGGTAVLDCAGYCGGTAAVDCAGVCGGGTTATECSECTSGVFDCAGTCDGEAVVDCSGVCGGGATATECSACTSGVFDCAGTCDGEAVVDSAGVCDLAWDDGTNEGTYNLTSAAMYEGEACSGTAITGRCVLEYPEADCPATCCYSEESDDCTAATTETACTDGQWMTGICIIDGDGSDEASPDACVTSGGNWFDGFWIPLTDIFIVMLGGNSATFGADGVFTSIEGEIGTYTIVDNVITTTISCCYDNDTDDCTDATSEATCTDGDWEVETVSGTFNTDGTITLEEVDEGECENGMYETKTECEAAYEYWHDAECISTVWTLSP